ncbi:MAG: hypothetical protein ED559_11240 [Phycisphaera sp.]|nr:MAG: hypothetical protein ED559_11240 [Phycisphaera sp.]
MNRVVRMLCCLALIAQAGPSSADDFTDRLNASFQSLSDSRRAETVLMPALGSLEQPPGVLLGRADRVLLLTPSSPVWQSATAWSMGESQQAALEALKQIAEEENPRRAMEFALPYGINGVSTSWVRQGIHAELGDPPTIAAAKLGYLERMQWLESLVHIEATRLADEGDIESAMELVFDLAILGRMMADRMLAQEVSWGLEAIRTSVLRMRDLAYVDSQGQSSLTSDYLKGLVERINMERGMFRLDRIRLPLGDQLAAEQMSFRVFGQTGQPDQAVFPTAMAELAATDRPLRLFAESGRWSTVSQEHADRRETERAISGVFSDWSLRWTADTFDPQFRNPSAYATLDPSRLAVVREIVPDLDNLLVLRRELDTELVGTRLALAVRAMRIQTGNLPSSLALVRPVYIEDLGIDPYNPQRSAGNKPEFRFFVPVRDTVGTSLHQMNVIPQERTNFRVALGDEEFVLYSLGGNEFDDRAVIVSDSGLESTGDYLIWPPVLGLLRDYLEDTGASE